MTGKITFRLRGPISGSPSYQFSVERRYAAGHQLTAGEAQALDQLRAENIQHNLRSVFASELAAVMPGELLSPDAIARVQGAIDSYAERYAFLEKHQSRGRPGAIERQAQAIAEEAAEAEARGRGRELSSEEREEAIQMFLKLPWVQEEARKRVEDEQRVAQGAIEDLL